MGGKALPQRDSVADNCHQSRNQSQGQGAQALVSAENQDRDGQDKADDTDHRSVSSFFISCVCPSQALYRS